MYNFLVSLSYFKSFFYGFLMVFQAKIVTVKGLVLAVAVLLLGQAAKVQAGCGDHVELGRVAVRLDRSAEHPPAKGRACFGPQCSKKSHGLPGNPQGVTKRWVEKIDLVVGVEWNDGSGVDSFPLAGPLVLLSQGQILGVFHPPRC